MNFPKFYECCGFPIDSSKKDHDDHHLMAGLEKLTPDRLSEIFDEQSSFEVNFCNPKTDSFDRKVEHTRELILYIHKELSEVLDSLSWKIHRKQEQYIDREHYLEEVIDCTKYLLNLCIIWDITPEEFYAEFFRKSKIVKERYEKEKLIEN